jgi:hypothetical protein
MCARRPQKTTNTCPTPMFCEMPQPRAQAQFRTCFRTLPEISIKLWGHLRNMVFEVLGSVFARCSPNHAKDRNWNTSVKKRVFGCFFSSARHERSSGHFWGALTFSVFVQSGSPISALPSPTVSRVTRVTRDAVSAVLWAVRRTSPEQTRARAGTPRRRPPTA